jgi:hypothetical protein
MRLTIDFEVMSTMRRDWQHLQRYVLVVPTAAFGRDSWRATADTAETQALVEHLRAMSLHESELLDDSET